MRRLSSITWNEILTRSQQELNKRWDLARYRLNPGSTTSARRDRATSGDAHFFFSCADIPALVMEMQRRFPLDAEQTIRHAERIREHEFDLLGYEGVSYGRQIAWHLDAVHGKRAPRKPWFRIRYLNFEEAGDSKIIWELNRHQHFVTLAKAYRLTDREEFAKDLFTEWFDWQRENPYPIGINWASNLEVAFRTLSWLWMWNLLAGSPIVPANFARDLFAALATSGRHIERYLSTYFSPNTHLLGEGVALFFLGTLCPQLSGARRWQTKGWDIIVDAGRRQVRSDGMYFEQSTYYHVYALDFFLYARILAAANGRSIPPEFDRTIEKMLEFLGTLAQSGIPPRLGDDDGGRLFDPRRNRAAHLLDPLAIGAVVFNRPDFKAAACGVTEETLWLLGNRGLAKFDSLANEPLKMRPAAFTESGIYALGDAAPNRAQVVIDAGPQGSLAAGHGHADALSLHFAAEGREILVDPGTYCYVSGDNSRDVFRGTRAHNTLQIDGRNQAVPKGPFSWESVVDASVETWITGKGFELFRGAHAGYAQTPEPVIHRRFIFHLKSCFWLVRDLAIGHGEHSLDLFWHFAPGMVPSQPSPDCFVVQEGGESRLVLLTNEGSGWAGKLEEGSYSPVYGRKEVAPVLHFHRQSGLPAELYSLFSPFKQAAADPGRLLSLKSEMADSLVSACAYKTQSETHQMVFSEGGKKWRVGRIESEAKFLYCLFDRNDQMRRFVLCEGSSMKIDGRMLFNAAQAVSMHEWPNGAGEDGVSCGTNSAPLAATREAPEKVSISTVEPQTRPRGGE